MPGPVSGVGAYSHKPSSPHTNCVPAIVLPISSAEVAPPSRKVNVSASRRSEESPQQSEPSSAGSASPGLLIRVNVVLSGATTL